MKTLHNYTFLFKMLHVSKPRKSRISFIHKANVPKPWIPVMWQREVQALLIMLQVKFGQMRLN